MTVGRLFKSSRNGSKTTIQVVLPVFSIILLTSLKIIPNRLLFNNE